MSHLLPEPRPAVTSVERWADAGSERDGLVALDRNERLSPLPSWFLAELRDRLDSPLATAYPSTTALRHELAHALALPPNSVFVTAGTDSALRLVYLAYVRPGDAVVRLDPTYAMVPIYGTIFAAHDVSIAFESDLSLDEESLLDAIGPGVRLVVIANPNQPTGTSLSPGAVGALAERCERVGALLVLDEAYYPFGHETALELAVRSPNVLVLRTFSKAAGLAGLRVGFAVGSPSVVHALANVRAAGEVNSAGLEAARLVLAHPELVDDYVAEVAAGRAALETRVAELGVEVLPSAANFVVLRLPAACEPAAVSAALRKHGLIVKGPFSEPCLRGCIRVTLGPVDLMDRFADSLARVFRELA